MWNALAALAAIMALLANGLCWAAGTRPNASGAAPMPAGKANAAMLAADAHAAVEAYLAAAVLELRARELSDLSTAADWYAKRSRLRAEFAEMLALSPLPERTPLQAVVTGTLDRGDFVVERLHFQSRPGLYVTANLYRPREVRQALPAVVYLCGHSRNPVVGCKASYQRHGIWFARNGFVCLILDTIELGELGTGKEHHGTCVRGPNKGQSEKWWWHAAGYTPGGPETWNAMRAIDYLNTRPEVDPQRIGVTGRSGGGAMSWALAALDDRIQCAVPVAGITDLHSHVAGKLVNGHCDCMYYNNTFGWDFSVAAALIAPRPLMLGNSDADPIFPVSGYRAVYAGYRRVYELLGAVDKLSLVETSGGHTDTPELRQPAFGWMNRWLADKPGPVDEGDLAAAKIPDGQLRVFVPGTEPTDAINRTIDEHWLHTPSLPPLADRSTWEAWRTESLAFLRSRCFRAFPARAMPLQLTPRKLVEPRPAYVPAGVTAEEVWFLSEPGIWLRAWLLRPTGDQPNGLPGALVVLGQGTNLEQPGPEIKDWLTESVGRPTLLVEPRGVGASAWSPDIDQAVRRRFVLVGRTVDGMRVWDALRGLEVLLELTPVGPGKRDDVVAVGAREAAMVVAYAAMLEPRIAELRLFASPFSHREPGAAVFLNVLRRMDFTTALAVLADRRVNWLPARGGSVPEAVKALAPLFERVGGRFSF